MSHIYRSHRVHAHAQHSNNKSPAGQCGSPRWIRPDSVAGVGGSVRLDAPCLPLIVKQHHPCSECSAPRLREAGVCDTWCVSCVCVTHDLWAIRYRPVLVCIASWLGNSVHTTLCCGQDEKNSRAASSPRSKRKAIYRLGWSGYF